ncbi:MAG: membrane integrity-associated transporter subunit PqiC [Paenirhodobacter sp.]|uniref:PqiC family protein n=1 Tax=Paenirhodobacter sp. TaxID=1965326 RepID=UPI003D0F12AE
MKHTALVLTLLALAACSNPLDTARYTIDPEPAAKSLPNRLGQAELREVSLPQYASGQEITWKDADGALRSTPKEIWADDPPRAVTLALAREISAVSGATVIAEPWPLSGGPDRRIEVRVEQFLATDKGAVRLAGSYYVSPVMGAGGDTVRRFDISVPLAGAGAGAIAQAQSQALAQLASQIAALR